MLDIFICYTNSILHLENKHQYEYLMWVLQQGKGKVLF